MNKTTPVYLLALFMFLLISHSTAQAQATRTWVSGVGDDVNPCSRTAPCKTFAGAISKTAPGGEINALDPGGFGGVTITKAITIDVTGTLGGILASGFNGIVINAAATDTVRLRGLDINGAGTGINGIRVLNAASVQIEDCSIYGFTTDGVDINATGTQVSIVRTVFRNNARAGVEAKAPSGTVWVAIDKSDFAGNLIGVLASDNSRVTCTHCVAAGNTLVGLQAQTLSNGTTAELNLESCAAVNQSNAPDYGVIAGGGGGTGLSKVRMSNVNIFNNNVGFGVFLGGTINTFGNNKIDGNGSNIGALSPLSQQ